MNKQESRYFATAAKMDDSLLRLMEKQEFEYVTVRDICREAGVNRSTFYLHYENTTDLLAEAFRRVQEEFRAQFDETAFAPDEDFISEKYLLPYLAYVRSHRRLWQTVLRQPRHFGTEKVYRKLFERLFEPILDHYRCPEEEREYLIRYYLTGVNAVVETWIARSCAESDETMCRIIMHCIHNKRP